MPYNWNKPIEIRDARNGSWFWVEKSVWENTLLTSSDKVLYGTLAFFANGKTQESFPSLKTLAHSSALSERQIALSIKKLEGNSYISIRRTAGKPNRYTLLKTRYAKFAGVQNSSGGYAKEQEVPMQNSTTNNNHINNNYLTTQSEIVKKAEEIAEWAYIRASVFPSIPQDIFKKKVSNAIGILGYEAVQELYKYETNAITFLSKLKSLLSSSNGRIPDFESGDGSSNLSERAK